MSRRTLGLCGILKRFSGLLAGRCCGNRLGVAPRLWSTQGRIEGGAYAAGHELSLPPHPTLPHSSQALACPYPIPQVHFFLPISETVVQGSLKCLITHGLAGISCHRVMHAFLAWSSSFLFCFPLLSGKFSQLSWGVVSRLGRMHWGEDGSGRRPMPFN